MKKELLILVIFFLCLCSINTDTDCSDFETYKQATCASLTNADQYCYYDSDTDVCQSWYKDCTEYNPESGFDENICKKITIPRSDTEYSNKKCGVVSGANGKKSCQRVYKECKELLTQDLCISNLELGLGDDKRCVWSEDKCELHYKSCTDDNIKTNQTKCITNIPDGNDKNCVWKSGACQEEYRKCKDFLLYSENGKTNLACNSLKHDDNKICFEDPDEEQCIETYKECGGIALGTACTKIKPLYETLPGSGTYYINYNKICSVNEDDGNKCYPADRNCEEYLGQDKKTCEQLKPKGEDAICFYDETQKKCTETYEGCGNKVMEEAACRKLSPINDNLYNSIHHYFIDYKMKCALDSESKCKPTERICNEYVEGGNAECRELKSEKDPNGNKAHCYLIDGSCKDMYDKCEYFNDLIGLAENREKNKINCTSNMVEFESGQTPADSYYYKCSLDDGTKLCSKKKKTCEEIKDLTKCAAHVLDDANQMCIVNGNDCKQVYTTCKKYDDHYNSNRAQITKNDCELIPIFTEDSKNYQCVYSETPNKKCEKKEINCEDYTGNVNTECEAMLANDTTLYKCAFVNNKCVTQYIDCVTYNNQILNKNEKTYKDNCETIVLADSYRRCFVEKDKQCVENIKICSDYTGEDETECSKYRALDSKYKCVIENKKCVEKFVPQENYYYFCSDYKGTDQKFCQSIQPHTYFGSSYTAFYLIPDYSSKCVYENGCTKVSKKCSEAKDETECGNIIPDDDDKICIYKSGCIEQYKSCKKYEDNEEAINQNTCESITIAYGETENEKTLDPIKYRCKYTAGASGAKGTCRAQLRTCSEFTPDLIKGSCSGISLADASKKCVFSNNKCSSQTQKTCMELISENDVNSDICEEAKTSSTDKKCVLYRFGCREYTNLDDPFNPILQQQTGTQQSNNSASFRLNILLLFLYILL